MGWNTEYAVGAAAAAVLRFEVTVAAVEESVKMDLLSASDEESSARVESVAATAQP